MNARIQIRDIPINTPPSFLNSDDTLTLDLGDDFTFSLTTAATEGNELNAIKREGTSSFAVPITPKNTWALRKWVYPNNSDKDFTRIRVHAFDGNHILTEDRLDVLSINFQDQVFEVGLFESPENGVADGANDLLLNSIDFGTFEFTDVNIQANWLNHLWEDGVTDDVYFGLVHYGNFIVDKQQVTLEDFRPLFSVMAVLRRGFCTLGWVFETPLEDTEWFRSLWVYILGKRYFETSDYGQLYRVEAQTSLEVIATPFLFKLYWDDEISDPGNNHEYLAGPGVSQITWNQPPAGKVRFRITGQIINPGAAQTFNIFTDFLDAVEFSAGAGETLDIDIYFDYEMYPGVSFAFGIGAFSYDLWIQPGFKLTVEPLIDTWKAYYTGDVITVQESIDSKYTFLQFLQGLLHFGFRFDIDHGQRTVTMYGTEDADVFGEGTVEGYYKPGYAAKDLTEISQEGSVVITYPQEETPEALIIAFAPSTDKYIESLEVPEDSPLYSKRLEFPSGKRDFVDTSENPFFEPTANYLWFGEALPKINTPAMWDNDGGDRSFEIAPRLLVAAGLVEQTELKGTELETKQWSYAGALRTSLPYVFQVPGAMIGNPPAYPSGYFVYDDETFNAYSIWDMWMKLDNRFYRNLPTIDVLLFLSNLDYHTFSFRDRVLIRILGRPTNLKAIAIHDFQTENKITTSVTFQIDPDECS